MNNNKLANRIRHLAGITLATLVLSACSSGGDGAAVNPTLAVSNVAVAEGNDNTTNLVFTLRLSSAAGSNASVSYATSDITATTADNDYETNTGTVTFNPGSTSATIIVTVNGDTAIEEDETLLLTLSSPNGVVMAATTITATGTISNDDNGGYYTGSVTHTWSNSPDTTMNGLHAIFNNNEFVIASVANDLLYKGTITSRNGTAYTATVHIYKDGVYASDASVNGTFRSGLDVDGALSGTGDYATGSFSLTYSALNERSPLSFVADEAWASLNYTARLNFITDTSTRIRLWTTSSSNLGGCEITSATLANVNSEQPGRIRSFEGSLLSCSNIPDGSIAQGYLTKFDDSGSTDNRIFFVIFNDNDTHLAVLCPGSTCNP